MCRTTIKGFKGVFKARPDARLKARRRENASRRTEKNQIHVRRTFFQLSGLEARFYSAFHASMRKRTLGEAFKIGKTKT